MVLHAVPLAQTSDPAHAEGAPETQVPSVPEQCPPGVTVEPVQLAPPQAMEALRGLQTPTDPLRLQASHTPSQPRSQQTPLSQCPKPSLAGLQSLAAAQLPP